MFNDKTMKKSYDKPTIHIITLQHSTQLLQARQKGRFTDEAPAGGWGVAQSKGWKSTDFWGNEEE